MTKIKLMIVDDELISRNMIKKILEGNDTYEVAADLSGGKAAIEWLRNNEIDILLCDMQMPGMNGVELIRMVHVINEFIPVIAVSSFDNFDYVRGSLVNGAANYLLKHELTGASLLAVLDQVTEKYRITPKERLIRHRVGYSFYDKKEFTAEKIRTMADEGIIEFQRANMIALAIGPDFCFPQGFGPAEYKQDICRAVTDILGQTLGNEFGYLIWFTKKAHLVLLLSFPGISSTLYMLNVIHNLTGRLQRQIMRLLGLTVTIVQGNLLVSLERAVEEAYQLDCLLGDKLYLGGNRVISLTASPAIHYSSEDIPAGYWKQLIFVLEQNPEESWEMINDVFDWLEDKRVSLQRVMDTSRRMVTLMTASANQMPQGIAEVKRALEYIGEYEIFEQFRHEVLGLYTYLRRLQIKEEYAIYSPVIVQVLDYIQKNYTNGISLETCAEYAGSSYTYLSRQFKQETGMRFVEHLNKLRVKKAKSLLMRGEESMKEIVEQSGFRSYTYFFKLFKESEGMTPSEFAAKI